MSGISSASRDAARISVPQRIYQDFASAPRNLPTFSANLSDLGRAEDAAPATAPTLSAETLTNMSNQPTYVLFSEYAASCPVDTYIPCYATGLLEFLAHSRSPWVPFLLLR